MHVILFTETYSPTFCDVKDSGLFDVGGETGGGVGGGGSCS